MSWDYIHEDYVPSQRIHYCTRDTWDRIDIQIEGTENFVSLTKKEWRQLRSFMSRYEFDDVLPHHYEVLPANVVLVIQDWLRVSRKS